MLFHTVNYLLSKIFFLSFKRKSLTVLHISSTLFFLYNLLYLTKHEKPFWKLIEKNYQTLLLFLYISTFKQKFDYFNFINFLTKVFLSLFFFFSWIVESFTTQKKYWLRKLYIYFFVRHRPRTKLFAPSPKENPETILYNDNYFQFRKSRICVTHTIYTIYFIFYVPFLMYHPRLIRTLFSDFFFFFFDII